MTKYSSFNLIYRLQKWMDSVPGQTFLNYAYSWGAAIVILGTLFKLTHLPGANIMLFLGMGTEVCVFFLSAFDRPFDKTADGMDLPTHLEEERVENNEESDLEKELSIKEPVENKPQTTGVPGGVYVVAPQGQASQTTDNNAVANNKQLSNEGMVVQQTPEWVASQQQVSPEMEEATSNYVEELKKLTDTLNRVSAQSERLTRDSEEMENLNRTLTGICKVYEMQLKGASQQIGTIDQINDQTRKMAQQIEQLNSIYARMIEAMTVNMRAAAPQTPINTQE